MKKDDLCDEITEEEVIVGEFKNELNNYSKEFYFNLRVGVALNRKEGKESNRI
jgi:hypothetical protein